MFEKEEKWKFWKNNFDKRKKCKFCKNKINFW